MTGKPDGRSPVTRAAPDHVSILADAGTDVGLGHVVRSCALAAALAGAGWHAWVATPDDRDARRIVKAEGIEWRAWPDRSTRATELLIVDSYRWAPADDEQAISRSVLFARIMDGAIAETNAHIVIDGAPGADPRFYRGPRLRSALAGPQFALVPGAFRSDVGHREDRVVVALGGGGSADLVAGIVGALGSSGWPAIDVIAGPYATVPRIAGIDVHRNLDPRGVATVFARARFGIVGGGQTLLQAAASGLACAALVLAENQRRQVDAMAIAGALVASADASEPVAVGRLLAACRPSADGYVAAAARARSLIDGYGADRAAAGIMDTYAAMTVADGPIRRGMGGDH